MSTREEQLAMINAMRAHGGSFVRALAEAFLYADDDNGRRLENAFPKLIENYRKIAATMPKEPT